MTDSEKWNELRERLITTRTQQQQRQQHNESREQLIRSKHLGLFTELSDAARAAVDSVNRGGQGLLKMSGIENPGQHGVQVTFGDQTATFLFRPDAAALQVATKKGNQTRVVQDYIVDANPETQEVYFATAGGNKVSIDKIVETAFLPFGH